jgi:hypothetical protein
MLSMKSQNWGELCIPYGIEDGDVRTRQLELSDQRIKQLEDDLDKFRRVSPIMNSTPILSLALHSVPRNKALQC